MIRQSKINLIKQWQQQFTNHLITKGTIEFCHIYRVKEAVNSTFNSLHHYSLLKLKKVKIPLDFLWNEMTNHYILICYKNAIGLFNIQQNTLNQFHRDNKLFANKIFLKYSTHIYTNAIRKYNDQHRIRKVMVQTLKKFSKLELNYLISLKNHKNYLWRSFCRIYEEKQEVKKKIIISRWMNDYYLDLYTTFSQRYRYVTRVEDAMQAAFTQLCEAPYSEIITIKRPKSYMYTVIKRKYLDICKSEKIRQSSDLYGNLKFVSNRKEWLFQIKTVKSLQLSPIQITTFSLSLEGYSYLEIGKITNAKNSTVATRINRVRAKAKSRFGATCN